MPSRKTMFALSVVLMQLLWAGAATAALYPQPPAVSGFAVTGFIQAMTLDNPGDVLSGGTVTVNGQKIVIPRNTIVILSASNVSWQELWAFAPCPWGLPLGAGPTGQSVPFGACTTGGNGASGLALGDVFVDPSSGAKTVPLTTNEVTIVGNRIGNGTADPDYVAGLVSMAQQALNLGAGFVNYIDYATGTLHVGGPMGAASPRDTLIQLNDPVGRFGRVVSADPRWTADTDNPTIHSKTAYPMCIPRAVPPPAVVPGAVAPDETDPLCPQRNRPLDPVSMNSPLGNFTLCNPGAFAAGACRANTPPILPGGGLNALATVVPDSDATNQAPFVPGDFIEWAGTLQVDRDGSITGTNVANQPYVSAWNIEANVGIYTSPGATPAYLNVEESRLGVGGTAITAPVPVPQEVTTRILGLGFFTDPQRSVDLFAVEVDPCTGEETEVLMLVAIPNKAGGVPWGRFRDVDQAGLFPVTRQWRARYHPIFSDPAPPLIAANGLTTMQFTLPVGEFILTENTVYGDPTLLVMPNNFQDFPFLAQGEGPWRGDPLAVVGQLTPFPLTDSVPGLTPPAPAPFACPAAGAPSAIITPPNQTVSKNAKVTLSAASSHSNPVGDALGFQWIQMSGPPVTLADPFSATTSFQAPNVTVNTGLTFDVLVTDLLTGRQSNATTLVTVTPFQVRADTVAITAANYKANRGVLTVNATSSDITCAAILTVQALASNGATLLPPNTFMQVQNITVGGCAYQFQSGRTVFPPAGTTLAKVTVLSSEGGSDVCPNGAGCLVVVK